jgi:hypothetical protein
MESGCDSWKQHTALPPRSPDLIQLDYHSRGHVKTVVRSSQLRSVDELKARIMNTIHAISELQLKNVFNELESRFERCVLNDGRHVEAEQFELFYLKTIRTELLYGVYSMLL